MLLVSESDLNYDGTKIIFHYVMNSGSDMWISKDTAIGAVIG